METNMKMNYAWLLLGIAQGLFFYSAVFNLYQSYQISELNKELLSIKFDQDVCNRRIIELTAHERVPKK
jgi:hypothetical protein